MRRHLPVILALAMFFLAALCQGAPGQSKAIGKPGKQTKQQVRTIFDYQKELGLTEKQINDIRTLYMVLKARLEALNKNRKDDTEALKILISKEADLKQIRAKLQEIADLSVESGCADVEASRKINAVMTPEQLKKWRSIQAAAREAEAKKK
jgi:Spy/CpxP family protein refolding chaperone